MTLALLSIGAGGGCISSNPCARKSGRSPPCFSLLLSYPFSFPSRKALDLEAKVSHSHTLPFSLQSTLGAPGIPQGPKPPLTAAPVVSRHSSCSFSDLMIHQDDLHNTSLLSPCPPLFFSPSLPPKFKCKSNKIRS